MDFLTYQKQASETAVYAKKYDAIYPLVGLVSEVGEVCSLIKRNMRDGVELDLKEIEKELGDVLWYLSALATDLGLSLDLIARNNIEKLKKRMENQTIHGKGGDR